MEEEAKKEVKRLQNEFSILDTEAANAFILEIAKGIFSDNLDQQTKSTKHFRILLAIEKDPPIDMILNAGCVQRLVDF